MEKEIRRQLDIFGNVAEEDWEKEWLDMPEYAHKDKTAERQLIINFKNEEDLKNFSNLIGQKITSKTKSIWFPKCGVEVVSDKMWVSEQGDKEK